MRRVRRVRREKETRCAIEDLADRKAPGDDTASGGEDDRPLGHHVAESEREARGLRRVIGRVAVARERGDDRSVEEPLDARAEARDGRGGRAARHVDPR